MEWNNIQKKEKSVRLLICTFCLLQFFSNGFTPMTNPTYKVTWEKNVGQHIRERFTLKRNNKKASANNQIRDEKDAEGRNCSPFMVAIVGIPGSGKTTGSRILSEMLQDLGSLHMPFDGYHVPLAVLAKEKNAKDLIYRRGAPETFDHELLYNDLRRIRDGTENTIDLPGFCHTKGDPEQASIQFHRNKHNIVVCEGLYLLHDAVGWDRIKECFDLSVYINANLDECLNRLKIRNQMIPGYTPEEINIRVDAVDRVNAMIVERSRNRSDLIVDSAVSG